MVTKKLKLKVGLEIIFKPVSISDEPRIVGNVLGWEEENLIVAKITDRTMIHHFSNNRSVLVGCVNDGVVFGFNSKIIMNIVIKGLNLFVIDYPEKLEVFPLRKEERMGVFLPGTFKFVESG